MTSHDCLNLLDASTFVTETSSILRCRITRGAYWDYYLSTHTRVSGYPAIRKSGYPAIRTSGHPDLWVARFPHNRLSENPDIRLSGHPDFQISG